MPIFNKMRQTVAHILPKIYQHPFNTQLAQGSLPKEIFQYYMQQDALYLADFATALRLTAQRLKNKEHAKVLNRIRTTAIQEELSINNNYLNSSTFFFVSTMPPDKSSVIADYTKHLLSAAQDAAPEVALSCLLPCFFIYRDLGLQMHSLSHPAHLYRKWIEACSSQKYIAATQAMIGITGEHYAAAPEAVQKQMLDSFKKSTTLELDFFEDCFYREWYACNKDNRRTDSIIERRINLR